MHEFLKRGKGKTRKIHKPTKTAENKKKAITNFCKEQ
jgi:hypothetical protein